MIVGNQATDQINQAVDGRTVPRMLNLGNVFELVDERLDNRAFSQQ